MVSLPLTGPLTAVPTTAQPAGPDPTEWVGPGLLGFVVIVVLGVATYLLWRNMNKQLRKVRVDAEPRREEPPGHDQASERGEPAERDEESRVGRERGSSDAG